MNFLFKNLLAAKDEGAWIQLVIVAVIIGVGIIKSIISGAKTMMEQKSDESEDEQTPVSAEPKKRYVDADDGFKTLEQLREEKIAQIRATYGIPEPPIQKEPQTISVEEPLQLAAAEPAYIPPSIPPPHPIEKPIHRPRPQKPVAHTATAAASSKISAEKSKAHIPAPQSATESIHKQLFSSPDDLRNAVMYQEILGKPLALRDT
jgi:hypothetical protein